MQRNKNLIRNIGIVLLNIGISFMSLFNGKIFLW